jgi:hypothetical protein
MLLHFQGKCHEITCLLEDAHFGMRPHKLYHCDQNVWTRLKWGIQNKHIAVALHKEMLANMAKTTLGVLQKFSQWQQL